PSSLLCTVILAIQVMNSSSSSAIALLPASSSIVARVFRRFVSTAPRAVALVLLAGTGLSLLPPCLAQSGSWRSTANMREYRLSHAATLLNNGNVLVEG